MGLIENKRVLVTGGAGFIGSNLVDTLLRQNNIVICLDNFSTGKRENIKNHLNNPCFSLLEGDIRDLSTCLKAARDVDIILHQAALGSVPRSVKDPITTNEVNINGFLNMLVASRDCNVKRMVYAASSSTYGDSTEMPKIEDRIGQPLSPYAVTKYVNELYASVFSKTYKIELVGLRYFNVFGPKQDPHGAYAAVIPLFIKNLISGVSPVINGDGSYSRDFTYVANVIMANQLAATVESDKAINTVYNIACGNRTTLTEMVEIIKGFLSEFDQSIKNIEIKNGPERVGDIPHSLASIEKAKQFLGYNPKYQFKDGLKEAIGWYWENLK